MLVCRILGHKFNEITTWTPLSLYTDEKITLTVRFETSCCSRCLYAPVKVIVNNETRIFYNHKEINSEK